MSGALQRLDRSLVLASRWIAAAGVLLLFLNAIAVVADVALRALFRAPIDRLSDVSSVVYYVAAACCLPAATATRRHVTIRALEGLLPPRAVAAVELAAALLTLAVFVVLAAQAWQHVRELAATGRTLSQIAFPIAPFWAVVAALVSFNCLLQAVLAATQLRAAPLSAR